MGYKISNLSMDTVLAEQHIAGITPQQISAYEQYFVTLAPRTVEDVFRRWMFAYASVHTTWESNCRLYQMLKPLDWMGNIHVLRDRIQESRAGLHNNRAEYIMNFSQFFWRHPHWFNMAPGEDWFQFRDRIMERAPGIGKAKAAFLLELTCFHRARVACFDTHMVQLYGYTAKAYGAGRLPEKQFDAMEHHWAATCAQRNVSPVTARWIYWDQKMGKPNSSYWAHVLEE